jgi:hypothetical protein
MNGRDLREESVGTLLGHFVTEPNGLGRYFSEGVSVGDGIHQYDSEGYLNSLEGCRSTSKLLSL